MDGYVITESGQTALNAIHTYEGVRYVAELDTGQGFIATDDLDKVRHLGDWIEPKAFFWPWRAAPKRAVGNGYENFALGSIDLYAHDEYDALATGLVAVKVSPALATKLGGGEDDFALIETDGKNVPGSIWQGKATGIASYFDIRKDVAVV